MEIYNYMFLLNFLLQFHLSYSELCVDRPVWGMYFVHKQINQLDSNGGVHLVNDGLDAKCSLS
jgi:hypothetical protein